MGCVQLVPMARGHWSPRSDTVLTFEGELSAVAVLAASMKPPVEVPRPGTEVVLGERPGSVPEHPLAPSELDQSNDVQLLVKPALTPWIGMLASVAARWKDASTFPISDCGRRTAQCVGEITDRIKLLDDAVDLHGDGVGSPGRVGLDIITIERSVALRADIVDGSEALERCHFSANLRDSLVDVTVHVPQNRRTNAFL